MESDDVGVGALAMELVLRTWWRHCIGNTIALFAHTHVSMFADERDKFRLYSEVERQRAVRTLRAMKQHLVHERSLKLDAFHHVEDLLQQVELSCVHVMVQ